MNESDLLEGFDKLNELSELEYGTDLAGLLSEPIPSNKPADFKEWRVGRLLGVALKEPFCHPEPLRPPQFTFTKARRSWQIDPGLLQKATQQRTGRYKILETLYEENVKDFQGFDYFVSKMDERGFFRFMAISIRRAICGKQEVRSQIADKVKQVQGVLHVTRNAGGKVETVGREFFKGVAAEALAPIIILNVPWLATAPPLLVAGVVFMILYLGIDGFCQWARSFDPHTDQGEER